MANKNQSWGPEMVLSPDGKSFVKKTDESSERVEQPSQLEESSQYAFWRKEKTPAQASTFTDTYSPHSTPETQPTQRQEQDGGLEEGAKTPESFLQKLRSYLPQANNANPDVKFKEIGKYTLGAVGGLLIGSAITILGTINLVRAGQIPHEEVYKAFNIDPRDEFITIRDHNGDSQVPDYAVKLKGLDNEPLPEVLYLRSNEGIDTWVQTREGKWRDAESGELIDYAEMTQNKMSASYQPNPNTLLKIPGDEGYVERKPSIF